MRRRDLIHPKSRRMYAVMIGSIVLLVAALLSVPAQAQSGPGDSTPVPFTTTTVLLGADQVIGGLYQPNSPTANQSTGLILTHETDDFIGSIPCVQLAQRGFTVLCVKSQFTDQAEVAWDSLALDMSASVTFLRSLPTVHKVVLVGWSGGGAIMSYYQNVAQNGVATCQAPARLDPCGDDLANMPPANGVVLLDAIPGIAFSDLTALDASVVNEANLRVRNENLDMFATQNGYDPNASSDYSTAFINRYTAAQGKREAGLVAEDQGLRQQIARGNGQFPNDTPMPVGRDSARIWEADSALISHTKGRFPLISPQHPDGSAPQVVHSVRVPSASASDNAAWSSDKGGFTTDSFLSVGAIRAPALRITDDSITGIDWASTNTATVQNVSGITTPLLIMSMTGHYWLVPSELYYQNATRTTNKTLAFVEGATHGFTPCTACATTPGEFGDTVAETFNYVANWLTHNFGS
jgi:pimeloyl-ACP methyl ester carboxylesterase